MATLEERIQNLTQEINPSSGAISDMEMMKLKDSLGISEDAFGKDATKPLDDLLIASGIGDIADLDRMSSNQKLNVARLNQMI